MKFFNRFLLGSSLASLMVIAGLYFLLSTETGLQSLVALTNRSAGRLLSIGSASGSLMGPLQLTKIRYTDGTDAVSLESLTLDWHPDKLLDWQISLASIVGTRLRIELGQSTSQESNDTALPPISMPLPLLLEKLQLSDIVLASNTEELLRIEGLAINRFSFRDDQLDFKDLTFETDGSTLQIQGGLQTNTQYLIKGTINAHLAFAGYAPIRASASLGGPLNKLQIHAELHTPATLQLDGRLEGLLQTPSWSTTIRSSGIDLPAVNQSWPKQHFRNLVLEGKGSFATYDLQLRAETGLPGIPTPVALAAEIHGGYSGLELSSFSLAQHKASLSAQGHLQWIPALCWQANITATALDPAVLFPQWQGQFSGALTTKGSMEKTIQAEVHFKELKGTLRGYPLSGSGSVELVGERINVPQFTLTSGGSRLEIKGSSIPKLDLALDLHSTNLAEIYPKASGSLMAKARIQGSIGAPDLDLRIEGSKIGFEGYSLAKLMADARGTIAQDGSFKTTVQASKLNVGGTQIDQASLDLQGSMKKHRLQLAATNSDMKAGCELQGSFMQGKWQGTLSNTHLSSNAWGNWQQPKASPLFLASDNVQLEQFCLTSAPKSSLCFHGSLTRPDQSWQAQASATAFPLHILAQNINAPWPFSGTLNASLQAQGKAQRLSKASLSAETADLLVTTPAIDDQQQKLRWQNNSLRGEYASNQLQMQLTSLINEKNALRVGFRQTTTDPIEGLLKQPVQGNIELDIKDLSILAILSNQTVIPSGTLQGQWTVNGPLLTPRINGAINLTEGKMEIPALGITLSPLHLSMKGDTKKIDIVAQAHSGQGALRATSTINLRQPEKQTVLVQLAGENFHAAKLPGIDLILSPDLSVSLNDHEIRAQGLVTIPKAQITSINFDQASAPSNDVVVVDGNRQAPTNQPLYLDLDIITGEEVKVNAYGLRGAVAGKLHIDGQPGRPFLGTGSLAVNQGTFTLYGKRLKIDIGRVHYTGGPLTNPGIELRSERKTDKATTGVIIEGFLQHPEITFYSTPPMEQSAIIHKMLEDTAIGGESREDIGVAGTVAEKIGLGGLVPYLQSLKKLSMIDEIKYELGDDEEDSSFVFGSWLTPDLYVSYGKDLVKESGTFNTKLNLGKGFSLFTETGALESGADIKYEFEH